MKSKVYRNRRSIVLSVLTVIIAGLLMWQSANQANLTPNTNNVTEQTLQSNEELAVSVLAKIEVKGRAPKTGYARSEFGNGWASWRNCDTRQRILDRDLTNTKLGDDGCTVVSGDLNDPYSGEVINFIRGSGTSSLVQIDHVVALSDAWQKGAQNLTSQQREAMANDDLELVAVSGTANQQKSDGDAATWLPANKAFRCQYVARQIAVKIKYSLWMTQAERDAIARVLETCPEQRLPVK